MPAGKQGNVDGPGMAKSRRRGFRLRRVLGALLLILILLISVAVLLHRTLLRAYAPTILGALANEMEYFYDVEFTWDGYSITGLNDFTISGISLRDTPSDSVLLTANSVRVRTSLYSLIIRGQDPIQGVTSVDVYHPVITLGRDEGRWNTGRLLERGEGEPRRFPGRLGVILTDGTIEWRGGEITEGFPFPPARISGLQGVFRLGANGGMGLGLEGMFSSSEVEPSSIKLDGTYDPERYLLHLNITADSVDLRNLQSIPSGFEMRDLRGSADTSVSILIGPDAGRLGYSILGTVTVSEGAAKLNTELTEVEVQDAHGEVHFTHESVFTSGVTATVNGSTGTIRGHVTDFGEEIPSADLIIEARDLDTRSIRRLLPALESIPVGGLISVSIEVAASEAGVTGILSAGSTGMAVFGFPATGNEFSAWYTDDKIVVSRMELGVLGGSIVGDGVVDLTGDEPLYDFRIAATGLSGEQITPYVLPSAPSRYLPTGQVSAHLAISGSGLSPSVSGLIEARNVRIPAYPDLPAGTINVPISYTGTEIRIDGANASMEGAVLLADGSYRFNRGFEGSIALTVEDRYLAQKVSGIPLEGEFAAGGDLSFTSPADAEFTGEVYLTDGRFQTVSAPSLSARIGYDSAGIRVWDIAGMVAGGVLEGEVAIPISRDGTEETSGAIVLSDLNLGKIMPESVGSTVTTSTDISVEFNYQPNEHTLTLDMKAVDEAMRVGPNAISTGEEGISVQVGIPLEQSGKTSLSMSGTLKCTHSMAQVYHGRVLTPFSSRVLGDITNLLTDRTAGDESEESPSIPLITGTFEVRADLTDLLADPYGSFDVSTGPLTVSGYEFASTSIHLASDEGRTWGVNLQVDTVDAGQLGLSGEIGLGPTLNESTLMLSAGLEDSGLYGLLALLGIADPGQTSGSIDGRGMITGTMADPVIDSFQVNLSESEVLGIPLDEGTATFSYQPPVLSIMGLEIQGSSGFRTTGEGAIDLKSPSLADARLVLSVIDFDLQALTRAGGIRFPFSGIATGTVNLAFNALGPRVLYNATIDDFEFIAGGGNLPLGTLTLSAESIPGDPVFFINSLKLARGEESIRIAGDVPADVRDAGAELFNLSIVSDSGYSLAIPPGLVSPEISWEGGLGRMDLALVGSIAHPDLSGEADLDIRNIRIFDTVIPSLAGPIKAENSVITTSPVELILIGDTWELGVESNFYLEALIMFIAATVADITAPLHIADVQVALTSETPMRLRGPGLDLRLVPGTGVNAPRLVVQGGTDGLKYLASGRIAVAGGQINIAELPIFPEGGTERVSQPVAQEEELEASPFEFDLHGEVLAGLRVIYYTSLVRFDVTCDSAAFDLTGNMSYPVVSGNLVSQSGWLDLFDNHFVLTEPLEIRISRLYPPNEPHIRATAERRFREVRSPGFLGRELVVTCRIDGRLSTSESPIGDIQFTSQPPLSEDQIMAALAYEYAPFRTAAGALLGGESVTSGFQDMNLTGIALPFATSFLSRYMRREAGFSDFEITFDQEQNVYVYLEREIFDDVVMYYSQEFGPDAEDEHRWGARYRWRPRSWVGFEIDNDEEITPQVQYIIPIDFW